MKFVLLGLNPYDFTDAKTGKQVSGNTLHLVNLENRTGCLFGCKSKTYSVNDDLVHSICNQSTKPDYSDLYMHDVEVVFNEYGKPAKVTLVK
jgi:hypothetical protein